MPLVGYVCPTGGEEPGRRNEPGYCFAKCAAPCVEPPLLAAMHKADTTNYHQGDYISASMLAGSGCARQTWFERFEPFYELPKRRYWSFRGTHAHSIIEGAQDVLEPYGWLQEIRMETALEYDLPRPIFDEQGVWTGDFNDNEALIIKVKGTCDATNPFQRKLVDMKTMSDDKVRKFITGRFEREEGDGGSRFLEPSWIMQTNIYRWLLARTPIPQEVKDKWAGFGLPVSKAKTYPAPTKLSIQAIAPMEIPHSGMSYGYRDGYKVSVFSIDGVPVIPLAEVEAYVRPKALQWYRYLVLKQKPPLVAPEKAWICKSCTFNGDICFPEKERKESV